MNIVDKAVNYFNPIAGRDRAKARIETSIINYADHGASRKNNSFFGWKVKSSKADDDTTKQLSVLRSRSRDLYMSGSVGTAALKTLRTNVIGKGLTCKPQIDHKMLGITTAKAKELELAIEREWLLWSNSVNCDADRRLDFGRLQRLAFFSKIMNGDVLVTMPYKDRGKDFPYKLTVQLIEGDRLRNPYGTDKDILEGVELDENGEVVAYHVGSHKDTYSNPVRLEAFGKESGERLVLHLFEPERVGQRRGIPLLSQVIESIQQLTKYSKSEVKRAALLGVFTAVITTEGSKSSRSNTLNALGINDDDTGEDEPIELGSQNIVSLNPGEDMKTVSATNAQLGFEQFFKAFCVQIGAILEIPSGVLMKNFTDSYSASRAELLEFWKMTNCEQDYMAKNFCQPIYERFLIEAQAKGRLKLPGFFDDLLIRQAYCSAKWIGASKGNLNPLQEVRASVEKINAKLSTREIEATEYGNDYDEVHAQRVEEEKADIEGGLKVVNEKQEVLGV